jgi:DNA-binding MarR family transcriptional regulator
MIKKNIYSSFIKYIYESNLTQVQYRLVLYLLYNSDKSYKFITNNSFLINTLGATKKTIIEAVKELVRKNIVSKNNLQNGYELAVIFEQKKEVKEAPAEHAPTPAEVSSDTTEVAPAENPKRSRKSKQPAEPTPIPIKEVISKLEEKAPAEPTYTEVAPAEKPKRSKKPNQETEPVPPIEEAPAAETPKPKKSRKTKKDVYANKE